LKDWLEKSAFTFEITHTTCLCVMPVPDGDTTWEGMGLRDNGVNGVGKPFLSQGAMPTDFPSELCLGMFNDIVGRTLDERPGMPAFLPAVHAQKREVKLTKKWNQDAMVLAGPPVFETKTAGAQFLPIAS
jgi:hypothetical protein